MDFNFPIARNGKTNENLLRIVKMIMADFYLQLFARGKKKINDINDVLTIDGNTVFNIDGITLLERVWLFYQQNKYLHSCSDMDQNIMDQMMLKLRDSFITVRAYYGYELGEDLKLQLAGCITLVLSRLLQIKSQFQLSYKNVLATLLLFLPDGITPVFEAENVKILQL